MLTWLRWILINQKGWDSVCKWYRETHTSAATGMLSNRSQIYTFTMVVAVLVFAYDGYKRGVRREWNEALAVLTVGATAAKVWKRTQGGTDAKPTEASG